MKTILGPLKFTCANIFYLIELSGFSLDLAVKVEHGPVALNEPPASGHVNRVPGVAVPSVDKLLAGEVLGRFAVTLHNLKCKT